MFEALFSTNLLIILLFIAVVAFLLNFHKLELNQRLLPASPFSNYKMVFPIRNAPIERFKVGKQGGMNFVCLGNKEFDLLGDRRSFHARPNHDYIYLNDKPFVLFKFVSNPVVTDNYFLSRLDYNGDEVADEINGFWKTKKDWNEFFKINEAFAYGSDMELTQREHSLNSHKLALIRTSPELDASERFDKEHSSALIEKLKKKQKQKKKKKQKQKDEEEEDDESDSV